MCFESVQETCNIFYQYVQKEVCFYHGRKMPLSELVEELDEFASPKPDSSESESSFCRLGGEFSRCCERLSSFCC